MRKNGFLLGIVAAFLVIYLAVPAVAWHRTRAEILTVLPEGSGGPQGLTVGPDGNVYVASFGFDASGAISSPNGLLFVIAPDGHLIRQVTIQNSSPHLLGLAFHPLSVKLLVLDFGNGNVLTVDSHTGNSSVFSAIPSNDPSAANPTTSGINGLCFDRAQRRYASIWVTDPLLTTTGVSPFGTNGDELNSSYSTMFVANTGNDTIVLIPVNGDGSAGKPSVFVNSINGADGIVLDRHDNIWVAANQADEIVVIDKTGSLPSSGTSTESMNTACRMACCFRPAQPSVAMGSGFLSPTWDWICDCSGSSRPSIPSGVPSGRVTPCLRSGRASRLSAKTTITTATEYVSSLCLPASGDTRVELRIHWISSGSDVCNRARWMTFFSGTSPITSTCTM